MWLHYKPSLFQHIGTHSSLKGKVQKLKVNEVFLYQIDDPYTNISLQGCVLEKYLNLKNLNILNIQSGVFVINSIQTQFSHVLFNLTLLNLILAMPILEYFKS